MIETLARLDRAFDELRYDEMADAIYHFVWGTFCDWYVELIKGSFGEETRQVAAWAFDQILVMLHPLMPFITGSQYISWNKRVGGIDPTVRQHQYSRYTEFIKPGA